uniref:Pollen Ole e 1 allergen and extensin family protein n=1 Tax=Strongyloides papillosus TaxID=174720 RepID=A0A0N5C4I1_STREA
MFLRLLTVLLIFSISFNPDSSFFVNGDVTVKGTPHFENGPHRIGGKVYIKCKNNQTTNGFKKIKNNEPYKVFVKTPGPTIPDCDAVFTLRFSKTLQSICDAKQVNMGSYLICPFSVNISYSSTEE